MLTRRTLLTGALTGVACGGLRMPIAAQSFGLPDGYFVPAEEVRHERTFMQWPASTRVHPDPDFLMDLQESIADIANTISAFEPVVMLMNRKHALLARRMLSNNVEIWDIPTDDLWARDSGPLFAVDGNGGLAVSNLNFNGWGNKQFHRNDGLVAQRVAERLGLPVYDSGITGEPGGVETDGAGTLMAHESSWVNPNRNDSDRAEIEARLLAAYGATKMIWAPGIAGADITDDHIDALARFVAPGQILIQLPDVSDTDPFSLSAFETYDILAEASDARGQRLQLVDLPYPERPRVTSADFVASYVNYYVCNGAVIAAEFGDRDTDQEAARVLADLYPDREIMMLNVDPVGETGGGIHCATQQQPATR